MYKDIRNPRNYYFNSKEHFKMATKTYIPGFQSIYSSEYVCVEQIVILLSNEASLRYVIILVPDSNKVQMGQIILTM